MSEGEGARRADYMEAMLDLAYELGYDAVTVEQIATEASGSSAGFEAHFPAKQDCAIAVLTEIAESNLRVLRSAFQREPRWPDSLRAAAYAHVRWLAENPKKLRFGLLETLWAGDLASALRDDYLGVYVTMVDAGREVAEDPDSIPAFAAESVVGSITQVVARNIGTTGGKDLAAMVPEMMYLAVRPYLGEEAARRELTMPRPSLGAG